MTTLPVARAQPPRFHYAWIVVAVTFRTSLITADPLYRPLALDISTFDEGSAFNPAYVHSMVSVSSTPELDIFRGAELRSMYVPAEA